MLELYLSSVVVWMIIIFCALSIFKKTIIRNGWVEYDGKKSVASALLSLFALSAIPIFRLFIVVMIMYMAANTKEKFDKQFKDRK